MLAAALTAAHAEPVIDDRGRALQAPLPAHRIVTLAPHLAEMVHAAGAGERLVGTVAYSDHPPGVAALPVVGDAFRVDLERLAAMRPDLVLAWLGGNPANVIDEVERLGLPVVALHAGSLDDIGRHLRLIGRVGGTAPDADAAAAVYEARLRALRERYADRPPVRVFYQVSERPLYTIGGRHAISDAISLCGGVNVFVGLHALAPAVGTESVLAAEPEVIVGGIHPPPGDDPGELSGWQRWSRLPAVQGGHLYQLDATLMGRPTPRLLDGVEALCDRIDRAR